MNGLWFEKLTILSEIEGLPKISLCLPNMGLPNVPEIVVRLL